MHKIYIFLLFNHRKKAQTRKGKKTIKHKRDKKEKISESWFWQNCTKKYAKGYKKQKHIS